MPGWDLALDAMTDLAHAFTTREYKDHVDRFAESLINSGKMFDVETGETIDVSSSNADRQKVHGLLAHAHSHIDQAEPVWVNADVTDLIEYGAEHETFTPQAILPQDLFEEHAFCLFERPMKVLDMRGLEFWFRAISWSVVQTEPGTEGKALLVCKWSHRSDPDPLSPGRKPLLGGSALRLSHADIIPFGEDRFLREPNLSRSIAQYESLWTFAEGKVVLFAREHASRYAFKRAKKKWRNIKEVTVLRLRRAEYRRQGDESYGEWVMTYRTNTNAHWRRQHYASLGPAYLENGEYNAASHKRIWIEEYIRGPEDAPLILKRHATEITR